LQRFVRAEAPSLPVTSMQTLQQIDEARFADSLRMVALAGAGGLLALLLASLGLYGVVSLAVRQRTREIGIRIALGAQPVRIRGMVMREMLWILLIGVGVGVPAAMALSKVTESQLFGVKSGDMVVVSAAVAALAVTAALAAFLPARRASKVDPLTALRYE
jgi:ABC-type antimicrobial peptide transport system permease subunit